MQNLQKGQKPEPKRLYKKCKWARRVCVQLGALKHECPLTKILSLSEAQLCFMGSDFLYVYF